METANSKEEMAFTNAQADESRKLEWNPNTDDLEDSKVALTAAQLFTEHSSILQHRNSRP